MGSKRLSVSAAKGILPNRFAFLARTPLPISAPARFSVIALLRTVKEQIRPGGIQIWLELFPESHPPYSPRHNVEREVRGAASETWPLNPFGLTPAFCLRHAPGHDGG